MKPEEIAPHVGKGKRLVTVEVLNISEADEEPSDLDTLVMFGRNRHSEEFWICGANIHSIRPVGEACEWRDVAGEQVSEEDE